MQESTTIHSFLKFPPYVKRWHGAINERWYTKL